MVKREFTFPSADGKTAIHAVEWLPEGAPRAVLQIAHGVSEYVLRYEDFAGYLTERGFAVVGNDHLGHGLSVSDGAPRLYFGPKGSWNWVVEDMEQLRKLTHEKFPNLPYFLLGHSMGSFLTRTLLFRYPDAGLRAAVICGTGWFPGPLCSVARAAAALCGAFGGWQKPAPLVDRLMSKDNNKAFAPARTPFDWLSRDTVEVDKYIADPRCGFLFTARGYYDMFTGLKNLSRLHRLAALPGDLPVLFISGDADPIGTQGKGVNTVAQQFRDAGVRDVTVHLYPGARHELFNETNRDEITAELIDWLNRHMK